ncbi:uncharacterized protein LOC133870691 [Alnus glutinosa]|uniref:uncharacterized protein LOC133870691 n=1 Tax=Alnus glutinosa TaxID=3517 RepID=UPI002D76C569|nr:uncharacterized protein LOC133870691 [Alnus glutinosa]
MALLLVGLVKLGMGRKLVRRKTGPWAFRRAHKPKPYPIRKSKLQFYSKGPLKPNSIIKSKFDLVLEASETLMKDMPEVPLTVGLVSRMSETLMEEKTKAPPVGLVPKISARVSFGFVPTSFGVANVPWTASSLSTFLEIMSESKILASFAVVDWPSDGGKPKPVKSLLRRGFLNPLSPLQGSFRYGPCNHILGWLREGFVGQRISRVSWLKGFGLLI